MKLFHKARDGTHSKWVVPITLLIVALILLTSYGYAALNTKLSISGEAYVRIDKDIRVTGIKLTSASNASETFQSNYSKDTISMGVKLNSTTSSITYQYTITNKNNEDYVIVDIKNVNNNGNVSYTSTANKRTIIPANSTQTYQITLKTTSANQTANLSLEFVFGKDEVTPPVITGGSNSWTTNNLAISLQTPGTATSGVKNYEYYISPSIANPGNNVTGTTSGNVTVSTEGTKYIYYRTVSNTGKKSSWSNYRTTKIDKATPTITMLAAGTYAMSDTRNIATPTYGVSGGKVTCTNTKLGDTLTKMSHINAFGNQTVKCTATGNNGKSSSKTVTYKIYSLMTGASMACTNTCTRSGNSMILPASYTQYGPYKRAAKGCYKVTYEGSGFANDIGYLAYQNSPSVRYTVLSKSVTSTRVTYYFNLAADATGSGIEVVIQNHASGSITINSIKVEPVNTCPAS